MKVGWARQRLNEVDQFMNQSVCLCTIVLVRQPPSSCVYLFQVPRNTLPLRTIYTPLLLELHI